MSKIPLPQYQEQPVVPFTSGQLPFYIGITGSSGISSGGVKPHYHAFAEFTFVMSGSGFKTINGHSHLMKPGATCLYLPHHVHESQNDRRNPPKVYCCMFDLQLLTSSALEDECLKTLYQVGSRYPSYVYLEDKSFTRMQVLLNELQSEFLQPSDTFGRETNIRCKLTEALLIFLRSLVAAQTTEQEEQITRGNSVFWEILRYIHVYYKEPITREIVAQHFHLSSPYVSRLFKEYTGEHFLQFVHKLRIKTAAHLLAITDTPVSEIAFEVGFESFRTFARVFRELKGQTPTEYRNAQREKASGTGVAKQ
ncbi:helix-turn-helix transcriptional regulator [Paenibacillus oceani]|uniref:Helix-turn-helix transcriptional regulator n=1 Tax=Paenibacillus oceani TaxID=2772510 RepID=A0A927CAU8_9BACL|nr:AraC family transcriptional regulator [Paenibacillus oceani]MBD2864024.1 helix-turn-helix transcriptional regulator [Paenibacillus oceani]